MGKPSSGAFTYRAWTVNLLVTGKTVQTVASTGNGLGLGRSGFTPDVRTLSVGHKARPTEIACDRGDEFVPLAGMGEARPAPDYLGWAG